MKVDIKLDEHILEPRCVIETNQVTEEIVTIIEYLSDETSWQMLGLNQNCISVLKLADIIRIYSASGKVFAVTEKKEYTLRLRLYEVEEKLEGKSFVRISNSEIINIKKAKKFDLSITGTICVTLSDHSKSYVSRRYVKKIKKILGL